MALGLCVGHVHFIFFVLISFASGTTRKPVFWWNMGFKVKDISKFAAKISPKKLKLDKTAKSVLCM